MLSDWRNRYLALKGATLCYYKSYDVTRTFSFLFPSMIILLSNGWATLLLIRFTCRRQTWSRWTKRAVLASPLHRRRICEKKTIRLGFSACNCRVESFRFQAENEGDRDRWIKALQSAIMEGLASGGVDKGDRKNKIKALITWLSYHPPPYLLIYRKRGILSIRTLPIVFAPIAETKIRRGSPSISALRSAFNARVRIAPWAWTTPKFALSNSINPYGYRPCYR